MLAGSNPVYQSTFAGVVPPPSAPPGQLILPSTNEAAVKEMLTAFRWPKGLQQTFINNLHKIPIRFFICDNSGSMVTNDGHRLVEGKRFASCTRWAELTQTLQFHATLANAANAPSEFRLLNNARPLLIGDGTPQGEANYHQFQAILNESPSGSTPLCRHIREVTAQIAAMAPQLRAMNQRACVVVLTDGESSDGDIAAAMTPLRELPVWVVVRLCTDEDKVVNYWNGVDDVLELDMDVLDDHQSEAEEIRAVNPWLTYGEPMHRLREFGIPIKEIDLLDEVALSVEQIRSFVALLLGGPVEDLPHPDVNYSQFVKAVREKAEKEGLVFEPISKSMHPWIRAGRMKKSSCTVS